jgi:hypothetical protein
MPKNGTAAQVAHAVVHYFQMATNAWIIALTMLASHHDGRP